MRCSNSDRTWSFGSRASRRLKARSSKNIDGFQCSARSCRWRHQHRSIYQWLDGVDAFDEPIGDLGNAATKLADFVVALQTMAPTDGPPITSKTRSWLLWSGERSPSRYPSSQRSRPWLSGINHLRLCTHRGHHPTRWRHRSRALGRRGGCGTCSRRRSNVRGPRCHRAKAC